MSIEVRMITATWCKRCQTMKPDAIAACALAGTTLLFVDYDELEEDSPMKAIKSLPTFQILLNNEWKSFSANEYSAWEALLMAQAVANPSNDNF